MGGDDRKVWLTGRAEIGRAIGCGVRAVPKLVRESQLPAFLHRGQWTARLDDLDAWAAEVASRRRPGRGGKV